MENVRNLNGNLIIKKVAKHNVFMVGWGIGDFSSLENATEVDYSSNKKIFELIFEKNINTYRVVKIK